MKAAPLKQEPFVVGERVILDGERHGTVTKPAVTRQGWGKQIFVEVKLDDGTTVYPRASGIDRAPIKKDTR
jgi:hypothetical protein